MLDNTLKKKKIKNNSVYSLNSVYFKYVKSLNLRFFLPFWIVPIANNFFFFKTNTHTYTRKRERGSNTKIHHKLNSKVMVNFKELWDKLYYTQHILLNNMG